MFRILPSVIFIRVKEALLMYESAVARNYRFQNAPCFDSSSQTPAAVLGYLLVLRLTFLHFLL